MLSAKSLQFDTTDWSQVEQTEHLVKWAHEHKLLVVQSFPMPPNIPCPLDDLQGLRSFYRNGVAAIGGGLVLVDVHNIKGFSCIRTIFKILNEGGGIHYVGGLTFPFAAHSFVIKVQCEDSELTSKRDLTIFEKLLNEGVLTLTEDMIAPGWVQDPYDPHYNGPSLLNMAEAEKYDEMFPDHPLTQTRKILRHIEATIRFDDEVIKEPQLKVSNALP